MRTLAGLVLGVVLVSLVAEARAADRSLHWPQWRGPLHTGEAPDAVPPINWSDEQNIAWRAEMHGSGNSTPIVVGDLVLVQSAIEADRAARAEPPSTTEGFDIVLAQQQPGQRGQRGGPPRRGQGGGRGRGSDSDASAGPYHFYLTAYDRHTGDVRWQTRVHEQVPTAGVRAGHATYASNSPISDGEHIWAYFGSYGLHCLDMDGNVLWSRELSPMFKRNEFGEGSSPALHGDTIVLVRDHERDSEIIALDAATGETRWSRPRDTISTWATPLILEVNGRPQVIVGALESSKAYDLETGETVWTAPGLTTNAIPSPVHRDGIVYLMSGFRGEALQAIRLADAEGELDEDHAAIVWTYHHDTSYVPSPLLYDGVLYFLRSNSGILTAIDADTGEPLYATQRLPLATVYSSPVADDGRIYITDRGGDTAVMHAGPEPEIITVNSLNDEIDASPVLVENQLFLRGTRYLYCIEEE